MKNLQFQHTPKSVCLQLQDNLEGIASPITFFNEILEPSNKVKPKTRILKIHSMKS